MTLAVTYTFTTTTVINPSYLNINFSDILSFLNSLYFPATLTVTDGRFVTADGANWDARTADASGLVDKTTVQTLTNKTLTSPVLNTGLSGTAFLDEDDLVSNSATKTASQQSIKAYCTTGMAGHNMKTGVFISSGASQLITLSFTPKYVVVWVLPYGLGGGGPYSYESSSNSTPYGIIFSPIMAVTGTDDLNIVTGGFMITESPDYTLYYLALG
jgi:hypothetical protein